MGTGSERDARLTAPIQEVLVRSSILCVLATACIGGGLDPNTGIRVSEVLSTPGSGDPTARWLEITNLDDFSHPLDGLELETGAGRYTFASDRVLEPGGYALIAASDDPLLNGGLPAVDVVIPGLTLGATADLLVLIGPDEVFDEFFYGAEHSSGERFPVGASIGVDPDWRGYNQFPSHWCDAWSPFGDGGFGTPGRENDHCDQTFTLAFAYDLDNGDNDGLEDDLTGSTSLDFWFSEHRRGFFTGDGSVGDTTRTTDATGQHLRFVNRGNGLTFQASRPFGSSCFTGGVITELPTSAFSGSWTLAECP